MRTIVFTVILLAASTAGFAQTQQWTLVDGRASLQSVILVPEKDAGYLYRQVNRWLIATFKNPEDVLKARIESEYLRGEAFHSSIFQLGALSSIDFQYTFAVDVKDGKVRLTFWNGILLYDDSQDTNGVHPIEQYVNNVGKKKREQFSANVLTSVNTLSNSLLKSLEGYLLSEREQKEDW